MRKDSRVRKDNSSPTSYSGDRGGNEAEAVSYRGRKDYTRAAAVAAAAEESGATGREGGVGINDGAGGRGG